MISRTSQNRLVSTLMMAILLPVVGLLIKNTFQPDTTGTPVVASNPSETVAKRPYTVVYINKALAQGNDSSSASTSEATHASSSARTVIAQTKKQASSSAAKNKKESAAQSSSAAPAQSSEGSVLTVEDPVITVGDWQVPPVGLSDVAETTSQSVEHILSILK